MRTCIYALLAFLLIIIAGSCRSEISEKDLREAAARSNELNHKYIQKQRDMYIETLEKRIQILEKDLEKLRGVSPEGKKEAGKDIESSVQQLAAEKALLEGSLRMLHEKSDAIEKHIDLNYNRYNYALDSILKDANAFYGSYKTYAE
jgi:hypothetical protein